MATDAEPAARPRRALFGIAFSTARMAELVDEISTTPVPGQRVRLVVTANVDHIVQLRTSAALRDAYRHSWRRTVDGMPVWLYARLRGVPVAERATGADMFPAVLERLRPAEHRLFFVVANDEIGQRLAAGLAQQGFAPAAIDYAVPSYGFEHDETYGAALSRRIRDHGTTHLFFGVGCPRSEAWIDQHRDQLGDCYAMAVGAALAFHVGVDRRAPSFMRHSGFEWLWRVALEPRRLGLRYFVRSWGFLGAVAADITGRQGAI